MRKSYVLERIAVRTGVAVWRHRLVWLFGALVVAGLGLFQLTAAEPSVTNGDCADTTMAAVTRIDDSTARAAYACLGPSMKRTTEDAFVAALHQRDIPNGKFSRIADQHQPDGRQIVFFTVEAQGQGAVGYIVYLDPHGLVEKVE
ncbi:MAG: hypothetical protein JOZ81_30975 [Chloroflexi bacterium]|nr:hypothetical protein [Chloroflexota bacterium]MBV9542909.1 hypothetical protein [Chloroflexota bacterium]